MKKQILNVGKALSRAEQKSINGGAPGTGLCLDECGPNHPNQCGSLSVCIIQACAASPIREYHYQAYYCVGNGPGNP